MRRARAGESLVAETRQQLKRVSKEGKGGGKREAPRIAALATRHCFTSRAFIRSREQQRANLFQ